MHVLRYRMRAPFAYSRSAGSDALVNLRWSRKVWQKFYFYSMARPNTRVVCHVSKENSQTVVSEHGARRGGTWRATLCVHDWEA